eukprot:353126-Chlamydomonas_euryale.AAC.5
MPDTVRHRQQSQTQYGTGGNARHGTAQAKMPDTVQLKGKARHCSTQGQSQTRFYLRGKARHGLTQAAKPEMVQPVKAEPYTVQCMQQNSGASGSACTISTRAGGFVA